MVLSSQTRRGDLGPRYMASRRKRRRRRWPFALLVILLATAGWWFWPRTAADPGPGGSAVAERPPSGGAAPGPSSPSPEPSDDGNGAEDPAPNDADPEPPESAAQGGPANQGSSGRSSGPAPASGDERRALEAAKRLRESGKPVAARRKLNAALEQIEPAGERAGRLRAALAAVNRELLFSPRLHPEDPLTASYDVKSGDVLVRIAPRYNVTAGLLERINRVQANKIRAGATLKVIRGPFHAVVRKSAFRMDLYLERRADGERVYARSFPVGLGEANSTPAGEWLVRPGGKLSNPAWTHPRTGEHYAREDPENPIGEHWVGLKGTSEGTRGKRGYGIHGTIEPDSIGREASLGCIRLKPEDMTRVFEMLTAGESTVRVVP